MRRGVGATTMAIAALAGALTSGCTGESTTLPTGGAVDPNALVERVVDGDTLVVQVDGQEERVRLIGVDTPESVKPDTPVECFGLEASQHTKDLLPPGTAVRLERDVEARDDYGRLLAYVYRAEDGLFVNLELVSSGFAQPLTIPPNVAYADRFVAAAREAQANDRGLWSTCAG